MEGLSIPADTAPKPPFIGITFRRETAEHDGHVGIAWRNKDGSFSLLHQRWHLLMTLDGAPDKLDAVVQLPLPKANVAAIIRYLLHFHKCVGQRVPYAFECPNAVFDEATGKLLLRRGEGLTCTTLVIALLAGAGVVLVSKEDWPARADDEAAHAALAERMRKSYIEREGKLSLDAMEHLAYLNLQKKATRFRPAEIAASASIRPLPAGFAQAESEGAVLLKSYNDHFYPAAPAGLENPVGQAPTKADATPLVAAAGEPSGTPSIPAEPGSD